MDTAAVRLSCHLATEAFNGPEIVAGASTTSGEADRQAAAKNTHPRPADNANAAAAVLDMLGQILEGGHRGQLPDLRQPVEVEGMDLGVGVEAV